MTVPVRGLLPLLVLPALLLPALAPPPAQAQTADSAPVVRTLVGDPAKEGPGLAVAMAPHGLALRDGKVLVADPVNGVVRSLDLEEGTSTTVAGLGAGQYPEDQGDGQPARQVQIGAPVSLAVLPDGGLLVGDSGFGGSRVRRITPSGTARLFAGDGGQTSDGDGGPATAASLHGQAGLAVAPDGSAWISDTYGDRVRRVGADGVIRTVVGTGEKGFSGDGGPASQARLDAPKGLAFTPSGDLLVADSGNDRIRRVDRSGTITTVAGSALGGGPVFGDGSGSGGDGGPATSARLHAPSSARPLPGGGFLVADTLNHKVRRVAPDGTIGTVAGGGTRDFGRDGVPAVDTQLFAPEDALPLPDGRVVVADTRAGRVRVVGTDGVITAVAGTYLPSYSGDGGPGTRAQTSSPHAVAVAPGGDVFFSDIAAGPVVRRLDASDGTVHPVAGYGPLRTVPEEGSSALEASFGGVGALAVAPDGALLVGEGSRVWRVDLARDSITTWAGAAEPGDLGDGADRRLARFREVGALRPTRTGDVLVVDTGSHRVRRVAADGTVSAVAGNGTGGFSGDGGPATSAQLDRPTDAVETADGTVLVADQQNDRLRAVARDGTIRTVAGSGRRGSVDKGIPGPALGAAVQPSDLGLLPDGRVLFTDVFACAVLSYDPRDGTVRRYAGDGVNGFREGAAGAARFSLPVGLAVDVERGLVHVGDVGNQRLRSVTFTDTEPVPGITVAPAVVSAGQRVTVTYTGPPGSTLDVFSKTQPATDHRRIATVVLDDDGRGTTSHAPQRNTRIEARTAGGVRSASPLVSVRSVASLTATRTGARGVVLTGRVYPARDRRLVSLYRDGRLLVQTRTDARGTYRTTATLARGTHRLQARTGDDTWNLGTTSPTRTVAVG